MKNFISKTIGLLFVLAFPLSITAQSGGTPKKDTTKNVINMTARNMSQDSNKNARVILTNAKLSSGFTTPQEIANIAKNDLAGRLNNTDAVLASKANQSALDATNSTVTGLTAAIFSKASLTQLRDSMAKIRAQIVADSLLWEYNYNYVSSQKLNTSDYLNPDWNATSGKGQILNKPQITSQWSFLGNALAGNTNAFFGTTDDYPVLIKQNNQTMLKLATPTDVNDVEGYAISLGSTNSSSDGMANSISMGYGGAGAENSISIGYEVYSDGEYSTAIGARTSTYGKQSVAIGVGCIAKSVGSTVLGRHNNISDTPDPITPSSTDRILQVGNGEDEEYTNNALTILRNGNTSIGSNYAPSEKLVVSGNTYLSEVGNGLIQKSPNGNCWKWSVSNTGSVSAVSIPCPN